MNFKLLIHRPRVMRTDALIIQNYLADPEAVFRALPIMDKCIFLARQLVLLTHLSITNSHALLDGYRKYLHKLLYTVTYELSKDDCEIDKGYKEVLAAISQNNTHLVDSNLLKQLVAPIEEVSDCQLTKVLAHDDFFIPYIDANRNDFVGPISMQSPSGISIVDDEIIYSSAPVTIISILTGEYTDITEAIDWSSLSILHILSNIARRTTLTTPSSMQQLAMRCLREILIPSGKAHYIIRTLESKTKEQIKNIITQLIITIREVHNVKIDDPSLLGRIIQSIDDKPNEKLVSYLTGNEEISTEEYQAFLESDFCFGELDVKQNEGFRTHVSTEADTGTDLPNDAGDNTEDVPPEDPPEEEPDPEKEPSPDEEPDPEEDAKLNKPPKPVTIKPNVDDNRSVILTLAPAETFDTLILRLELIKYIKNLIDNQELDNEQLSILKQLKTYWIASLSVQSILDVINYTLSKPSK